MEEIKILELFGGIGACTQAFKKLGIPYKIADYVEIDKYAVASYNAINGTNFEPQDITKWDKNINVDFIMHGSPCQDFSIAGKQAGGNEGSGTRSSLMYETLRIVEKLKPKYVLWENVKNLLSKKHRHNFDAYLEIMESLGYKNYYQVLNAKDYGIPQNRERVFTLSIRKDIDIGFKFPDSIELKLKLKDMLEEQVDEKYYLSDKNIIFDAVKDKKINKSLQETLEKNKIPYGINMIDSYNRNVRNDEISGTITTRVDASNNTYLAIKNATKGGYAIATNGDSVNLAYPNSTTRRGRVGHQVSQTLQCNDNMGVVTKENYETLTATIIKENNKNAKHQQDLLQSDEGSCRTIPAGTHASTPHLLKTITTNEGKLKIRKLTPKECWRLMRFF